MIRCGHAAGLRGADFCSRTGAGEYAVLSWVDAFNKPRLLELSWKIPPAIAEAHFYAALEPEGIAA